MSPLPAWRAQAAAGSGRAPAPGPCPPRCGGVAFCSYSPILSPRRRTLPGRTQAVRAGRKYALSAAGSPRSGRGNASRTGGEDPGKLRTAARARGSAEGRGGAWRGALWERRRGPGSRNARRSSGGAVLQGADGGVGLGLRGCSREIRLRLRLRLRLQPEAEGHAEPVKLASRHTQRADAGRLSPPFPASVVMVTGKPRGRV